MVGLGSKGRHETKLTDAGWVLGIDKTVRLINNCDEILAIARRVTKLDAEVSD